MTQIVEKPYINRRTTVEDASDSEDEQHEEAEQLIPKRRTRLEDYPYDPRFTPPPPAPWKRAALVIFIVVMFWLAFSMRKKAWDRKNKVVYAKRYSEEYKFRPAASPIVTEALRGGGQKIRGAMPTAVPQPEPTPEVQKKKKRRSKKRKPRA